MIYTDTVGDLGYAEEIGNYGEYSGGPNQQETYNYAKTVLEAATAYPGEWPAGRGAAWCSCVARCRARCACYVGLGCFPGLDGATGCMACASQVIMTPSPCAPDTCRRTTACADRGWRVSQKD